MAYQQPTLTEIFAELHLAPGSIDPIRCLDLLPPLNGAGLSDEVELLAVASSPILGLTLAVPRLRCWSREKSRLVQLSADLIVVNQLGVYPGWRAFEELFSSVRAALTQTLGVFTAASISLNTIDSMTPPREGFVLGKYLDCDGGYVPRSYADAGESADITLGRGVLASDKRNRQIRIAVRVDPGQVQITTNCVFHDVLPANDSLDARLAALHQESNRTFEGMITNATRALMGGKK